MLFSSFALFSVAFPVALGRSLVERQSYTVDPNTTPYCTWYYDNDGASDCTTVLRIWDVTLEAFMRWNPSITAGCGNFKTSQSYCIEAFGEPPVTTQPPTTLPTTTAASSTVNPPTTTTTTNPGNGIETPQPTQADMVTNCNKFYFVKTGDNCGNIASSNGVSVADIFAWNPSVGSDCSGMWAEVNICVGIIGGPTAAPPTSTAPGNGVETPSPIQDGMVTNCNKFHLVQSGDGCASIAKTYSISVANFVTWNPAAGTDCTGLWLNTYACVAIIGGAPAPTATTTAGNGIATPTPTQPGIVSNCDKFQFVEKGSTCATIAKAHGISVSQFVSWNPSVNDDCSGMWAEVYVCVSIIGHTPPATTTKPGNGIATPTPVQDGITTSCKTFHFVKSGDNCATIAKARGISVADFVKWNPAVGGTSCTGLWLNTYACVAVL